MYSSYLKRRLEHVNEQLISNHIEFLLVFTLDILLAYSSTPACEYKIFYSPSRELTIGLTGWQIPLCVQQ